MNIVVLIRLVPDLVEEIEVDASGKTLDTTWMRMIINELDEHAIEEAILIKERSGGEVTVVGPDIEDLDNVLFTAGAKGADRLIKLTGEYRIEVNNHALARAFAGAIQSLQPDLILTGVQAHTDMDGALGPLVAEAMGMPYIGYISGASVSDGKCNLHKEYPGGLIAEMEVELPAVLGIQAAESPPRYVAISKVRQAMKTLTIDEQPLPDLDTSGGPTITRMFQPESGERATMIDGSVDQIADKLVDLLRDAGVL